MSPCTDVQGFYAREVYFFSEFKLVEGTLVELIDNLNLQMAQNSGKSF